MNNRRLTLIRRARVAVEDAMRRIQFSDPLALVTLRGAHRHLITAAKFTLDGKAEFAEISMHAASDYLSQVLGAPELA